MITTPQIAIEEELRSLDRERADLERKLLMVNARIETLDHLKRNPESVNFLPPSKPEEN